MKWDILVNSYMNEDTGSQRLRIQHRLQAPIMSTDKVLFELAFKAASIADPTVGTLIKYDMVRCQMEMNTNDNRFWVPTLTDGYYTKDASIIANQEPSTELAENNNWVTPFADNNALDRWCIPANTSLQWSEY